MSLSAWPRLLVITPPRGPVDPACVEAWTGAGPNVLAVMLRQPGARAREILAADGRLAGLRRACQDRQIPTVLSIDPEELVTATSLATLPNADTLAGFHVRGDPDEATLHRARTMVPRPRWLSRACHGPPQPGHAWVDFTIFAPVFAPGTSEPGRPAKQPAGLAALARWTATGAPVLALGGVTRDTAAACLAAGASGLAGISGFFGPAPEVADTIATLCKLLSAT